MIRADALATLYLFHPLQFLRPRQGRVPILMYHSISSREETKHPYYQTVTSPEVFAAQMKYLHDNGYSTISPSEAASYVQSPDTPSWRPVVITFDDGFADFYTNAFPILSRYGFSAAVYLPTAFIGKSAKEFKGVDCLTWDQVRELHRTGIEFGSHTVTHPQLKSVKPAELEFELQSSKEDIEQELGCHVSSFAYPYAFPEADRVFTGRLRETLGAVGYKNGVSTIIGTASPGRDVFFMNRLPVNSCDGPQMFKAKLDGGYDWLHSIQLASKLMSAKR